MSTPHPTARDDGPDTLAVAAATVAGNLFLLFGTVVVASTATLFGWIGPRGRFVFACARLWSRGLLAASGLRVRASFATPLDPGRQVVYMSNHQGLYDIPALLATLPGPTRFLAKHSLFRIPLFGWALKLGGFVSIDRENLSRAGGSFRSAVAGLVSGGSLLVFPEGTRSLDGELLPFKRGGFLLALKAGLPIVPVGVRGTLAVQTRGSRVVRPGPVAVAYGRPIPVDGLGVRDRERLAGEVRARIAELAGVAG